MVKHNYHIHCDAHIEVDMDKAAEVGLVLHQMDKLTFGRLHFEIGVIMERCAHANMCPECVLRFFQAYPRIYANACNKATKANTTKGAQH